MKQDLNGVRTAQDIERKYDLSSIAGIKKAVELNENTITKVEQETSNLLESLIINLEGIVLNGAISLWFYSGVPSMKSEPEINWTTEEQRTEHLNDLYYDRETGNVYKYVFDSEYKWEKQLDGKLIESMALTNASIDTSDHERQVFFEQTPTPPYSNGDWYINENGDLYICQISKDETESYNKNDFIISSQYTYNTNANHKGNVLTVLSGRVTMVEVGEEELRSSIKETVNDLRTAETLIKQNVENISLLAEKVVEVSNTVSGMSSIQLTSCNEGLLYYLSIKGEIGLLDPPEIILQLTNNNGTEEYVLPINYLNVLNDISDEFRIENGRTSIIRNIEIDDEGNKTVASEPIIEIYDNIDIYLANGVNTLTLVTPNNLNISATYLLDTIYTDNFATHVQVSSEIQNSAQEIMLNVQQIETSFEGQITNTNQLIMNVQNGMTNTFTTSGGNNLLRNTDLAEETNEGYVSWSGSLNKQDNVEAVNGISILLQNGSATQIDEVPNGQYVLGFNYNKLLELSTGSILINGTEYVLEDYGTFEQIFEVTTNSINIEFKSDANNSYEIYDLRANVGSVLLPYSQNPNEIRSNTVTIGEGIRIKSDIQNTETTIDADGQRVINASTKEIVQQSTDEGGWFKKIVVEGDSEITGLSIKRVGRQVHINGL
ncbi:MAG: hypothetical protein IJB83_02725 [Bacilli bacterium]|nr:hypothetical protein [Bacilli bacterium]